MIPKIIHYCWFGGAPLGEKELQCIDSWKKFCPEYEVRRWDESNYDIRKNKYMSDAYDHRKWAFVSDYARVDVVREQGGAILRHGCRVGPIPERAARLRAVLRLGE